jgi:hypothetical protein
MSLLTDATDVFAAAEASEQCVVLFIAEFLPLSATRFDVGHRDAIQAVLGELAAEGWLLSLRAMVDSSGKVEPTAFEMGFAHDADVVGVFEAPTIDAALQGTVRLEKAGWSRRLATRWLLGPREFAAVNGIGPAIEREWGFFALWEWNDAWTAASANARKEYDAECDVAFQGDLNLNINIAGRHRLDWASSWHHLGAWEADRPEAVDEAMRGHEHAADFKFTTSRHFIGRRRPLADLLLPVPGAPS